MSVLGLADVMAFLFEPEQSKMEHLDETHWPHDHVKAFVALALRKFLFRVQ
jgi:hypothetical protein